MTYIYLKYGRCPDGILWVPVNPGKLRGWLLRVFRPHDYVVINYGGARQETTVMLPYHPVELESLRQVTVWASLGHRPHVMTVNLSDTIESEVK